MKNQLLDRPEGVEPPTPIITDELVERLLDWLIEERIPVTAKREGSQVTGDLKYSGDHVYFVEVLPDLEMDFDSTEVIKIVVNVMKEVTITLIED